MDSSDKFGLYLAATIISGILTVVVICMLNEATMDRKVVELIKAGTPPAEALCAIRPSYSGCVVRTVEKTHE